MKQSFRNGETCPSDGRYYCADHYRTASALFKGGDIFPNCSNTWGHDSGTTWLNWNPEIEEQEEIVRKHKERYGR